MKNFLGTVASFLLTAFFMGIILFVQIGIMEIFDEDNGTAFMVFTCISFLFLLIIVGFGKAFMSAVGDASYMSVCMSTVFYVIVCHALNFILFTKLETMKFVLVNLVVLFVYMVITVPIAVKGTNSKDDQYVDPRNPNNLPDLTPRTPVNNMYNNKEDR